MSDHSTGNKTHYCWLPRQGKPVFIIEFISQWIIKAMAFLPLYTVIIVTLMFLLIIFGVPFIGGDG